MTPQERAELITKSMVRYFYPNEQRKVQKWTRQIADAIEEAVEERDREWAKEGTVRAASHPQITFTPDKPSDLATAYGEVREEARQAALRESLDELAALDVAGTAEAIASVLRKKLRLAP